MDSHPLTGWTCLSTHFMTDDTHPGGASKTCEVCGKEAAEIGFILTHPGHTGSLRSGRRCAERLTGQPFLIRTLERQARTRASLLRQWLKRKWRVSARGNPYIIVGGMNLGLFRQNGRWRARIEGEFSEKTFSTELDAKIDLLESYLKRLES